MDFISSRGCVYKVNPKGSVSTSGYSLEGFPTGSEGAPIILVNGKVSENDLILPTSTLDRKKIMYIFGEDYGNIQVDGLVFLGAVSSPGDGLDPVIEYFQNNGVARNGGRPVNLSMPGNKGYKVYIQSLVIHQAQAKLNAHGFTLVGLKAEPPE